MKKVLFVLVLMMAVVAVNAQTGKTAVTNAKPVHTAIKVADLQKNITDNIAKDYAGFTIKQATSISGKNGVTYDVVISKGSTTETLVYDKDGVFVKKLPAPATHKTVKRK
jgi:hypothetical protein